VPVVGVEAATRRGGSDATASLEGLVGDRHSLTYALTKRLIRLAEAHIHGNQLASEALNRAAVSIRPPHPRKLAALIRGRRLPHGGPFQFPVNVPRLVFHQGEL
jgi:hypothetical protein